MVADVVGYSGRIEWEATSRTEPRKLLDVSTLIGSGWNPKVGLKDGIASTVEWYREHITSLRS